MATAKRDRQGNFKKHEGPKPTPKPVARNAYTPMFEQLRDELDAHHDRRDRIGKASRDVTALSKKIIFSLQRVRKIEETLPADIQKEINSRLAEIAKLLASIAPEVQTINRFRYARSLVCLEELVEALTFCHYLTTQTLISPAQLQPIVEALARQGATVKEDEVMTTDADAPHTPSQSVETSVPTVGLTDDDYIYGIFDLTGEMMRFATTTSALTGKMASSDVGGGDRDIVHDMHELGTLFEILPRRSGNRNTWEKKLEVTRQSVQKVEKLGYDLKVRGSERPKGWVPDLNAADQEDSHE